MGKRECFKKKKSLANVPVMIWFVSVCVCVCMRRMPERESEREKKNPSHISCIAFQISTWWKFILFSNSSHCRRKYIGSGRLVFITRAGNEGFFFYVATHSYTFFFHRLIVFRTERKNKKKKDEEEEKKTMTKPYIMRKPKYDCQLFFLLFLHSSLLSLSPLLMYMFL